MTFFSGRFPRRLKGLTPLRPRPDGRAPFQDCFSLSRWLALATLACLAPASANHAASQVLINEIMYHPSSGDSREEFIELYNSNPEPVELEGWRFSKGVRFVFPRVAIAGQGYLIIASDTETFRRRHPEVRAVIGNWEGRLSNRSDDLALDDSTGKRIDSVRYADEGDWAVREKGPPHFRRRGWIWTAEHDGGGKSLELRNPALANQHGQNWSASQVSEGTPGRANSVRSADIPPMILEAAHEPAIPKSNEAILIAARVEDESAGQVSVTLFARSDPKAGFAPIPMKASPRAKDRFEVLLPAQKALSVVEFYFEARDAAGNARFWPAPARVDGRLVQAANCLLQVDDQTVSGDLPWHRIIMTEAERAELASLGRLWFDSQSNAEMNGTFISQERGQTDLRYLIGIRNRGNGSRVAVPNNYRLQFRSDAPWKQVTALNLNSQFPFVQLLGSALFQRAGLPAAHSRAVQVRVNGVNLASPSWPMHGLYAANEVYHSEFADNHFPRDASGNIYRGIRLGLHHADPGIRSTNFSANLSYLGESFDPYRVNYFKTTNVREDDWSDLARLTRILSSRTPDAEYEAALRGVVHVEQWVRFLALNALLDNNETSLGNGDGDDYYLYRGRNDPRFMLLPYDLDTILGQGMTPGLTTNGIFRAAAIPALHRFLTWPSVSRRYYWHLDDLMKNVLAERPLNELFEQVLSPYLSPEISETMKRWARARAAHVSSLLPRHLTIRHDWPLTNSVQSAARETLRLWGQANPIETHQIRVNGQPAHWRVWQAHWELTNVHLIPGFNRFLAQALDNQGQEIDRALLEIWREHPPPSIWSGLLATNVQWPASGGPYEIRGELTVPAGRVLEIEPGTTLYFGEGAALRVEGQLRAVGTEDRPVRFTRPLHQKQPWRGLVFHDSVRDNRLVHCHIAFAEGRAAIELVRSRLTLEHVSWAGLRSTALEFQDSSLIVRHCRFPDIENAELIHGTGMPEEGQVIFENNRFGRTTGYNDVIDFTGGRRPGPIIQVLNNQFLGGGDDGLDLDGTDAHIEGNVFQGFQKDNASSSTSNAIATDAGSEIVVVRNVFYDNDHAILLKGGATLHAAHNTIVGSRWAALSFGEPERGAASGKSARLESCILWDNASLFRPVNPPVENIELIVQGSILSPLWPGVGNINQDPRFRNATNDFQLLPESPARGSGLLGLDRGAFVPPGASISGDPRRHTSRTAATLSVGGPGITHYRFRLNEGPFSEERNVELPIELSNLADGPYQIAVIGRNSAGVWQLPEQAAHSRVWNVRREQSPLVFNEVLANNESVFSLGRTSPDVIELFNESPSSLDLSGIQITDRAREPGRFVFPAGTTLEGGAYLLLYADDRTDLPGWHLGFALKASGESLYLYGPKENGSLLLDSITFGRQIPDYSLGRAADGAWTLNKPTLGGLNQVQPLGDRRSVRINEWLAASGDRDQGDFIELRNPGDLPVHLAGMFLTDKPAGWPNRFAFPSHTYLPAHGLAAWQAGEAMGGNSLSFRLASEQGTLALLDEAMQIVDFVWYGPQRDGQSQGWSGEHPPRLSSFLIPTPGRANMLVEIPSDQDADGLPDAWETAHGLNPRAHDARGDADGDGHTNEEEFAAGTHPNDASSRLRLEIVAGAGNELQLRFKALAGRRYALQARSRLSAEPWKRIVEISPDSADRFLEWPVPAAFTNEARFYRLLVLPIP